MAFRQMAESWHWHRDSEPSRVDGTMEDGDADIWRNVAGTINPLCELLRMLQRSLYDGHVDYLPGRPLATPADLVPQTVSCEMRKR